MNIQTVALLVLGVLVIALTYFIGHEEGYSKGNFEGYARGKGDGWDACFDQAFKHRPGRDAKTGKFVKRRKNSASGRTKCQ